MHNGNSNVEAVLDIVARHVAPNAPRDDSLVVVRSGVRHDEDWWYVIVRPDRAGLRSYDYSERLTMIEDEIREVENVSVLLVPTLVAD